MEIRVVHYLNQFFAGVGGEDMADVGPASKEGPIGPGVGISKELGDAALIVGTVWCGDNYVAANGEAAVDEIVGLISEFRPDVVIAGPSFASGRYGLACSEIAVAVQERLRVPAVIAMHHEAPNANQIRRRVITISTGETASGMGQAIPAVARLAVKLAKGTPLGPPAEEGYLPTGTRKNEFVAERASARAVQLLDARLRKEAITTELPLPEYQDVNAPPPLDEGQRPLVALVTEAGLVPKGNPDRMPSGWCQTWAKYDVSGQANLSSNAFEIIHGGFDTTAGSADPERQLPLASLRALEEQGLVRVCDTVFSTCGNMGSIAEMRRIGKEIGDELRQIGVDAAIVGST